MSKSITDSQDYMPSRRLIAAVPSRALFDIEDSNRIFEMEGEVGQDAPSRNRRKYC